MDGNAGTDRVAGAVGGALRIAGTDRVALAGAHRIAGADLMVVTGAHQIAGTGRNIADTGADIFAGADHITGTDRAEDRLSAHDLGLERVFGAAFLIQTDKEGFHAGLEYLFPGDNDLDLRLGELCAFQQFRG